MNCRDQQRVKEKFQAVRFLFIFLSFYAKFPLSKVEASLGFSTPTRPGFESDKSPTRVIMDLIYAA